MVANELDILPDLTFLMMSGLTYIKKIIAWSTQKYISGSRSERK